MSGLFILLSFFVMCVEVSFGEFYMLDE